MTRHVSTERSVVTKSFVGTFDDGSQILVQEHVIPKVPPGELVGRPGEWFLDCATRPHPEAPWGRRVRLSRVDQ